MDKSTTSGSVEGDGGIGNCTNSRQNPETLKHQSWPCTSNTGERKNYKRAANRGKKGSQVSSDRSYSTVRVLRSTSAAKQSPSDVVVQPVAKKSPDTVHTLVQPAAKRIKRSRPAVRALDNEFSKIRQRIRYILNRMNYEQSLLEAYASEGWKSQSLEKIRPEMELERAKAEIVRCKLRIREAFQNLDRLLSAGKLEESLFDSKGEISSEDIFCATCGLQNVTLDNDIILCDGVCDRGFHQKCLNPPLLTKDIPAGDEGWLCPACDCKIDCIDVINELQGTDLSLSDSWEKVFPEAVALAHGSKQNDVSDLPSDNSSEDNDFDPNIAEEYVAGHDEGSSENNADEGSDSDDSNLITSSDNSEHMKDKEKVDDLGLPSEDSEDDDYDPAGPDSDKDIEEKHNESDFTSDSDDFCAEIAKSRGLNEVSSGAKSGDPTNDSEEAIFQVKTAMPNPISKDPQMDQDVALPVSGRRQVQPLDYKKLYDDAYGEAPSDSSDNEEWSGKSTPEKGNEEQNETDPSRKSFRETGAVQQNNELTPQSARQNLHPDGFHGSVNGEHAREFTSNGGNNNTTQRRQFGPIINQRLHEHFKTDQYPNRAVKESLAQELGLAFGQVSKWFESKRRHTRALANKNGTHLEHCSTNRNRSSVIDPNEGMMEKSNVCKHEGIKQDNPVKQDIDGEQRTDAPPECIQSYTTTSGLLGCPKDESGENHGKNNSSRYVGRPKYGSADDHILGLSPEVEVSDDPNFVTSSGNSESSKEKEKVDELGLPSEDSEDDNYDPAGPDSDKDIKKKKSSSDDSDFASDSDFSSDSDDFCAEIAKSCGQEGVPSGAKAGGDSINDLEGTTLRGNTAVSDLPSKDLEIDQDVVLTAPSDASGDPVNDLEGTKLQANTTISDLPSKDLEMDQDGVLPVSAGQQKGAHGETSSDLSDDEDLPGNSTPEKDNGKHSEAVSFSRKSSSGTGAVHQSNESTRQNARQSLHRDAFHGSVNAHDAREVITPNGSNSATQRKYGPIISQRLHDHFKTDQYPCRAVKESLGQELGLTFRQVNKWFETTRHNTRVAASKNGSHLQNHRTNGNKSSFAAHNEVTDSKEMMAEKLNVCKNVNEGIQQDSPQKPDVSDGFRTHVTPPDSCQRYTTTSLLVGCPDGKSRYNNSKNAPSGSAARPKDGYAEDVVLALEVVDEGAKKAALRDLKKRKMGG